MSEWIIKQTLLWILCVSIWVMIGKPWAFAEPCVPDESIELLEISLEVQESSGKQTQFKFILNVTNPSNEPVYLCFSSAQKYDFIVSKEGHEVWRWSSGRMFAQVLMEETVKPEQTIRFSQTWRYKGNAEIKMTPGNYEVVGILHSHPEVISSPVTFQIPH